MKKIRTVFVDAALINGNKILLEKRSAGAFKGSWSLVGEAVEAGESLEHAMKKMVEEKTGLELLTVHMLGVYDDPDRNPEISSISVAFLCTVKGTVKNEKMKFYAFEELPDNIGFDHKKIIQDAIKFHKLLQDPFSAATVIPGKRRHAS
jgi:8-oxo-dGTP diphosphatase